MDRAGACTSSRASLTAAALQHAHSCSEGPRTHPARVDPVQGDIVLLDLRDYQDDKADIVARYTAAQVRQLQRMGELPRALQVPRIQPDSEGGTGGFAKTAAGCRNLLRVQRVLCAAAAAHPSQAPDTADHDDGHAGSVQGPHVTEPAAPGAHQPLSAAELEAAAMAEYARFTTESSAGRARRRRAAAELRRELWTPVVPWRRGAGRRSRPAASAHRYGTTL